MTTAPAHLTATHPPCRSCQAPVSRTVVDLGMSPLCETFLLPEELNRMEPFYPLHVRVCDRCHLVQLEEYVSGEEIFGGEYAYFSSYSDSWVAHAKRYADDRIAAMGLGPGSLVVEVASNDGYLLQHFAAAGIPVLGIEPAENVAEAARARGVPTENAFFGRGTAERLRAEGHRPDLMAANNVLAHVPDISDFVAGFAVLLADRGIVTFEFPHLMRLIEGVQYDTIYHEHFSYLSLLAVRTVLAAHGLQVVDVEELPTHGGSLRVHAGHEGVHAPTPRVADMLERELAAGYDTPAPYERFAATVEASKRALLRYLIDARERGLHVAAYGAPGKGNTLLNYCGIRTDLVDYAVDRNPYKHGRFTPGTHIPIHPPERLAETRPDVILILPWNLRDEIAAQLAYTAEWGARLIVPVPVVQEVTRP
ncbi:MAG: methyltransferase domain-containing protein [Thermoleophilia bacterium]|nr:methyltransferase domain-containing protein [Thermoleophilia bacterium]